MDVRGTLTNTASVTGTGVSVDREETASDMIWWVEFSGVVFRKSTTGAVDQTATHASQVIHYTIVVDNTGNVDLSGAAVHVTDSYADTGSLTLTASSDSNTSTLDVSQHWTYAATHTVSQTEMDGGGTLTNTASVTGTGVTVDSDDTATATTTEHQTHHQSPHKPTTRPLHQKTTHASQV